MRVDDRRHWKIGLHWLALLAWSGLIWFLTSRPSVPSAGSETGDFVIRQGGGHLLLHSVLALLAWRAAALSWGNGIGFAFAAFLAVPHAILDEVYQGLVPGRDANLEDVLYNLVGVAAALLLVRVLQLSGKLQSAGRRRAR